VEAGRAQLPRKAPAGAAGLVLQDHAFGGQLVTDAVGVLEAPGLARRGAQLDQTLHLGFVDLRLAGGLEPGLRVLPQETKQRAAGQQLPLELAPFPPSALALAARARANISANASGVFRSSSSAATRASGIAASHPGSFGPGSSESVR
jgi:hypothetical protein